jgi:hypothetical protein
MSISSDQIFESALSLPQAERAALAFQLLQTLSPPGDEITAVDFGAELRDRIEAHRRGELQSYSLVETRKIVTAQLSRVRA